MIEDMNACSCGKQDFSISYKTEQGGVGCLPIGLVVIIIKCNSCGITRTHRFDISITIKDLLIASHNTLDAPVEEGA